MHKKSKIHCDIADMVVTPLDQHRAALRLLNRRSSGNRSQAFAPLQLRRNAIGILVRRARRLVSR